MICPNCGAEATFTEHHHEWQERHGLDCGPYEHCSQDWLTCDKCGAETDDKELQANQPVEVERP